MLNLDASKVCHDSDTPSRIIEENADIFTDFLFFSFLSFLFFLFFSQIFTDFLHSSYNNSIYPSEFPILKLVNITPVFNKGDRNSKENYGPVSIFPNISKIFERCMFCQISSSIDSYLSKQQYGFRKGYSTQYRLSVMLEKWKNAVNKGKCFGALLTDLSKTFDYLSHELLIAKLHAYSFNLPALKHF